MKKVLILSGSPRKGGNSDLLCDQFMEGAKESGNEVRKINIAEKRLPPVMPATIAESIMGNVLLRTIWERFCRL